MLSPKSLNVRTFISEYKFTNKFTIGDSVLSKDGETMYTAWFCGT